MTTILLDSHVLHWWAAEPGRLSQTATQAVESADDRYPRPIIVW